MQNHTGQVGALRQELTNLDCKDTCHAIEIGKTAVLRGESPQRIAANIRKHWPALFPAR